MLNKTVIVLKTANYKETLENMLTAYDFECKENLYIVDSDLLSNTLFTLNENLYVSSMNTIEKLLNANKSTNKLSKGHKITLDYSWMKYDDFLTLHRGAFDLVRVNRKKIEEPLNLSGLDDYTVSHCGNIFGFTKGYDIKFYANDSLDFLFDVQFDKKIIAAAFSTDDTYVAISTGRGIFIYETMTAKEVYRSDSSKDSDLLSSGISTFTWWKNDAIFINNNLKLNIAEKTLSRVETTYSHGNLKVEYSLSEKTQEIRTEFTSKTYANVVEIGIFFGKDRIYALLKKKGHGKTGQMNHQYIVDSFKGDKITSTVLKSKPVDINFTASTFSVSYENHTAEVFKLSGNSFRNMNFFEISNKSIISSQAVGGTSKDSKEGSVMLTAIYNTMDEVVLFYQNNTLISSYTHNGATDIMWSPSGLYCAILSQGNGVQSRGVVQIFTIDGKLISKQIYAGLSKFEWRSFKTEGLTEIEAEEDSEEMSVEFDEQNVEELKEEWINYLKTKMIRT